jgi:hypothetical protein
MVIFSQSISSGRQRLTIQTTVGAGVPENSIHTVRVVGIANAAVEVNDDVLTRAGDIADIEDGTGRLYVYVNRLDSIAPYAASLAFLDDCGETGTSVFGGASTP